MTVLYKPLELTHYTKPPFTFQHKARAVCIGVNQLALGTERIQQDDLLRQVKHLEEELKRLNQQKTGLHKRALDVRNDVKGNAAALRYLETISQLERSFTVLTENVTETSVQLSSPKALPESVHVKKDLGDNVQSCWNYVTQLSRLTQVHIHNAAEYQQFHHALSKVEANLNKRLRMTHPDHMRQLPEELSSAPMIANELRVSYFQRILNFVPILHAERTNMYIVIDGC
ncbi:unnamed protein product [Dicrocoelium dendriticum]|nr:unnamed protein product [Dicrocoelium dendriticum]